MNMKAIEFFKELMDENKGCIQTLDKILNTDYSKEIHEPIHSELGEAAYSSVIYGAHASNNMKTYTSPIESIRQAIQLAKLKPGQTLIDIGSGYGKVALAFAIAYPRARIVGYEINSHRVAEARKAAFLMGLSNIEFIQADLSAIVLPRADYYYAYSPVNEATTNKIFGNDLLKYSNVKVVAVYPDLVQKLEVLGWDKLYKPIGPYVSIALFSNTFDLDFTTRVDKVFKQWTSQVA